MEGRPLQFHSHQNVAAVLAATRQILFLLHLTSHTAFPVDCSSSGWSLLSRKRATEVLQPAIPTSSCCRAKPRTKVVPALDWLSTKQRRIIASARGIRN